MTKKEAATILAILKAAYPNSYRNMTQEEAMGTISIWAVQFADMPADIVLMAVHKAISSSPFPPAISEVKEKLSKIYWEAESIMRDHRMILSVQETMENPPKPVSKEEIERIERICDATQQYGYSNSLEPSLGSMLRSADHILLGSGTT